jgi:hypothetical protein
MTTYPTDADGEALRRVAADSDMSKPMVIDFSVDVPDGSSGEQIASRARERGYIAEVIHEQDGAWTCVCSKGMLATYDGVLAAQAELDELSARFGGHSDGWGTAGNRAKWPRIVPTD